MRSARRSHNITASSASVSLPEIVFPLIPFVALIPNFYLVPDLYYNGLPTQELCFAWMMVALTALGLIEVIRQRGAPVVGRRDLLTLAPLVMLWLWAVALSFRSPDIFEAMRVCGIWLGLLILLGAGIMGLRDRSALWLIAALDLFTGVLALSQLYEYYIYREEMYGVFFSHGITSELLALLLPLQLTRYLTAASRLAAVRSMLIIGLAGAALLVNLRRGALLGVTVAVLGIALALIFKKLRLQSKWRLVWAVLLAVLVAAPIVYYKWETIVFRFRGATQLSSSGELGLTSRVRVWATALEMIRRHPVLGVGTGGFVSEYGDYRRYFVENPAYAAAAEAAEPEDNDEIHNPHSHSEYLELTAELGFVGLLLFLAFWVQVFRRLWQNHRAPRGDIALGALFGLSAFAFSSSLSGFSFRFTPGIIIAACVVSAGIAVGRDGGKGNSDQPGQKEEGSGAFKLSKAALVALLLVLLALGAAFVRRTDRVLESQQTQSGTDFRFSFKPGENEIYLARYEQVLRADPYNAGAHLGLGLLLYQMKRVDESIPHVDYALHHGYSRPFTRVLQAFNFEQAGRLPEAVRLLEECVANFPKSVFARTVYQEFLLRLGEIDRARAQDAILRGQDEGLAQSWRLALLMKNEAATAEAARRGLTPPDSLQPGLVRSIVQARAYHYLR
ncbi:MAG TPA: O-antigen ligase family protein [Blastocatellia bacterium]|nr:O-antigen ligase family protein [Blastocatellia bacterium]